MRIFFFLLSLLTSGCSLACTSPKAGFGYSFENLVDESERIFVVELSGTEEWFPETWFELTVIEIIKGTNDAPLRFLSSNKEHRENNFNDHNDDIFWTQDIGRSEWPCCICGPTHSFKKGYKYLYFPDLLGAHKSAEIVLNDQDKWYKFVKERVKSKATHNQGHQN